VEVILDGWGSLLAGRRVAAVLTEAGARVRIYNRFRTLFLGRLRRDHRKILLVDDRTAFIGGINIGEEYAASAHRPGWTDLAVEIHGEPTRRLAARLRGEPWPERSEGSAKIFLSGLGGGGKLQKRYLKAIRVASSHLILAHGYFLPSQRLLHDLKKAARRGVRVQLLLAGVSDVPFAHAATMRLYRTLLAAGLEIYEWDRSVLHAKAALVDDRRFLVGSFNLDPLSLSDLEALLELDSPSAVSQGRAWMEAKLALAKRVRPEDVARSPLNRWLFDVLGLLAARLAEAFGRVMGRVDPRSRRRRQPPPP
jgi:cardiolipin synthase